MFEPRKCAVEEQDAAEDSGNDSEAVQLAGDRGDTGGSGAEAGDEEADAEKRAADGLREKEGFGDVHEREVKQAHAVEPEDSEHGGNERAEHHFEDAQVGEVELAREA